MREFFKNLPDETTPMTADRFNDLFNGNEAMGSIVVDDIKCKNLFDIEKYPLTMNKAHWQGTLEGWDGYSAVVDYFPVDENTAYTISNNENLLIHSGGLTFYDSSKNVLSFTGNVNTFTTPESCAYIRFSFNSVSISWIQIEKGTVATEYSPYKKIGYNSTESMGKIMVDDISCKNLFNINNLKLSTGSINYETGTITVNQYANESLAVSALKVLAPDLIAGKTYTLSLSTTGTNRFIYLTGSSKIWYSGTSHTMTQAELDGRIIVYGENTQSSQTVEISNIQIEKGTKASRFTPYKKFDTGFYEVITNLHVGESINDGRLKNAKLVVVNYRSGDGAWSTQTIHIMPGYSLNTYSEYSFGSIYEANGKITFQHATDQTFYIDKILAIK